MVGEGRCGAGFRRFPKLNYVHRIVENRSFIWSFVTSRYDTRTGNMLFFWRDSSYSAMWEGRFGSLFVSKYILYCNCFNLIKKKTKRLLMKIWSLNDFSQWIKFDICIFLIFIVMIIICILQNWVFLILLEDWFFCMTIKER